MKKCFFACLALLAVVSFGCDNTGKPSGDDKKVSAETTVSVDEVPLPEVEKVAEPEVEKVVVEPEVEEIAEPTK